MKKEEPGDTRYLFECENCKVVIEKWLTMNSYRCKKCPNCGKNKLFQLFTTMGHTMFLESAKTFGKAAEINEKREGKEKMQVMFENDPVGQAKKKQESNIPWWRKKAEGNKERKKPLDVSKIKDTEKYIITGEE